VASLVGRATPEVKFKHLAKEMLTKDDYRLPIGCQVVEGVNLRFCVENRRDFSALVGEGYTQGRQVRHWLEKRYGLMFAAMIQAIYFHEKSLPVQIRSSDPPVDRNKPVMKGGALRQRINFAIKNEPDGMSFDELLKKLRVRYTIHGAEYAVVLHTYLYIDWSCKIGVDNQWRYVPQRPVMKPPEEGDPAMKWCVSGHHKAFEAPELWYDREWHNRVNGCLKSDFG